MFDFHFPLASWEGAGSSTDRAFLQGSMVKALRAFRHGEEKLHDAIKKSAWDPFGGGEIKL